MPVTSLKAPIRPSSASASHHDFSSCAQNTPYSNAFVNRHISVDLFGGGPRYTSTEARSGPAFIRRMYAAHSIFITSSRTVSQLPLVLGVASFLLPHCSEQKIDGLKATISRSMMREGLDAESRLTHPTRRCVVPVSWGGRNCGCAGLEGLQGGDFLQLSDQQRVVRPLGRHQASSFVATTPCSGGGPRGCVRMLPCAPPMFLSLLGRAVPVFWWWRDEV